MRINSHTYSLTHTHTHTQYMMYVCVTVYGHTALFRDSYVVKQPMLVARLTPLKES